MRRTADPHIVIISPPQVAFDTSNVSLDYSSIPVEPCIAPIGRTQIVIRRWSFFERLRRKLLGRY
ncbi:MAG: hypothetical protein AB7U18_01115 [Dehalococcoidia bacterium]